MENREVCVVEAVAYEAPAIESLIERDQFEREVYYAGDGISVNG